MKLARRIAAAVTSAALATTGLTLATPASAAGSDTVAVYTRAADIPLSGGTRSIAINPATHDLWIPEMVSNKVAVRSQSGGVLDDIAFPTGSLPLAVGFTADGSTAYVGSDNGSVYAVDAASDTITATIPVASSETSVTVVGTKAFVVSQWADNVAVINTTTNTVTGTIPTGSGSHPVYSIIADGQLYVTLAGTNQVAVIDPADTTLTSTITVGNGPTYVAASPDKMKIAIANGGDNTVTLINTADDSIATTATGVTSPSGLAWSADGSTVYSVPGSGSLRLQSLDAATGSVTTAYADSTVGFSGEWLARLGNTYYLGDLGQDTLYAINVAYLAHQTINVAAPSITRVGDATPLTATSDQALSVGTWASADTSVCTVNTTGVVTAVATGTCKITASNAGTGTVAPASSSATWTVLPALLANTVTATPATVSLRPGDTAPITATHASASGLSWATGDPTVATVTDGTITAVNPGTTTITVTDPGDDTYAGGTATVTVDVQPSPPILDPNPTPWNTPIYTGDQVEWQIPVSARPENQGGGDAHNVTVNLAVPTGVTLASATVINAPGATCTLLSFSDFLCDLGDIAAGTGKTVDLVAAPRHTVGDVRLDTVTKADGIDPVSASSTAQVFARPTPNITFGWTAAPKSAHVGDRLTWDATVTNSGSGAAPHVTVVLAGAGLLRDATATINGDACTVDDFAAICAVSSLPAGGSVAIDLSGDATAPGLVYLQAFTDGVGPVEPPALTVARATASGSITPNAPSPAPPTHTVVVKDFGLPKLGGDVTSKRSPAPAPNRGGAPAASSLASTGAPVSPVDVAVLAAGLVGLGLAALLLGTLLRRRRSHA